MYIFFQMSYVICHIFVKKYIFLYKMSYLCIVKKPEKPGEQRMGTSWEPNGNR